MHVLNKTILHYNQQEKTIVAKKVSFMQQQSDGKSLSTSFWKKFVCGGSLRVNPLPFVSMVSMLSQGFLCLRSVRLCSGYFYTVVTDNCSIYNHVHVEKETTSRFCLVRRWSGTVLLETIPLIIRQNLNTKNEPANDKELIDENWQFQALVRFTSLHGLHLGYVFEVYV